MSTSGFRRLWLAVVLLGATLSTAPVGSMEQAVAGGGGAAVQVHAVPAVRSAGRVAWAIAGLGLCVDDARLDGYSPEPPSLAARIEHVRAAIIEANPSSHEVQGSGHQQRFTYHAIPPPGHTPLFA